MDLKDILSTIKANASKKAARETGDRPALNLSPKKVGTDSPNPKKTKREINLAVGNLSLHTRQTKAWCR